MSRSLLCLATIAALAVFGHPPVSSPSEEKPSPANPSASGPTTRDREIYAFVDGEPITRSEVEAPFAAQIAELHQRIYELRKRSLDRLVNKKILEREARKRGVSVEELIQREVKSRIPPITEQEVDQHFARLQQRQGRHKVEKTTVRQTLYAQRYYDVLGKYVAFLKRSIPVQVFLEGDPQAGQDVASGDDPWIGAEDAPVTLVEFTEFQCPACKGFQTTLRDVLQEFEGQVKLIVRDFPLDQHPLALQAAVAAQCAHEQGKYWEYAALLFENQTFLQGGGFETHARSLGLEEDRFRACLSSERSREEVLQDKSDGMRAGVTGTPTLFVNGAKARDLRAETIRAMILAELEDEEPPEAGQGGKGGRGSATPRRDAPPATVR